MSLAHNLKFNRCELDGIKFQSKMEAKYYRNLKLRQKAGEIVMFLRQVRFDLPGPTSYSVDFLEFHSNGSVHFIDVKGRDLKEFRKAKKQVEALYPVDIEVVTKV